MTGYRQKEQGEWLSKTRWKKEKKLAMRANLATIPQRVTTMWNPYPSPPPILLPFRKNLSKAWNNRLVPIRLLFLLCMAILLAGGSASKVFQIFAHMGLGCVSLNTFFKCQRGKLFPTIFNYWQKYQAKVLEKVKAIQGGVVVAGDGRHDSMGHSAKFGAYTIFCCTLPMIIHFALIQRNQAGSSPAMEFMGFKQCMEYLLGCGITITTFISDRHTSIASHMKKVLTHIIHYFDIWHLKEKIRKVLSKLAKEKGCEVLADWIKPCENHLFWSASTTFSGDGRVIWAKFKTFMSHIINKHSSLDDPLFNRCGHDKIHPRKCLHAGANIYLNGKIYQGSASAR
ncbi:PREDICTED: uncharacterized protein LOC107344300 [Acropora digitifera]|uniref:uncharacterized protein LOC107344300 n=1 Tax=Acropora digitifera TaxID=70779 RepID=UPI00077ADEC0|nr:PREDICTED: uncharacterized protein LOC107344300 [Acropora digitifera]